MATRRSSVMTRVSVMPPSCTVPRRCSPAAGRSAQVEVLFLRWFRKLERRGARRRPGLTWFAGTRRAAPAPVYEQAVHRVRHPVKRGTHRRQRAERLPLLVVAEADLEDDPVLELVPLPVQRAVRHRRLGQLVLVSVFPPGRRELAGVKNLDRPPLSHAVATRLSRIECVNTIVRLRARRRARENRYIFRTDGGDSVTS